VGPAAAEPLLAALAGAPDAGTATGVTDVLEALGEDDPDAGGAPPPPASTAADVSTSDARNARDARSGKTLNQHEFFISVAAARFSISLHRALGVE
jgi:hypothetical protein